MDFSGHEAGDPMKLKWNGNDITGYCTSIAWSGSAVQAARSVTFSVAYSPNDKSVKTLNIKLGDKIEFLPDDKKVRFSGIVTTRERRNTAGTLSYTEIGRASCRERV